MANRIEQAPEAAEDIAAGIIRIDEGMKKVLASGLNKRALVVLLSDKTGVGRASITKVLDGLTELRAAYVTQKKR